MSAVGPQTVSVALTFAVGERWREDLDELDELDELEELEEFDEVDEVDEVDELDSLSLSLPPLLLSSLPDGSVLRFSGCNERLQELLPA